MRELGSHYGFHCFLSYTESGTIVLSEGTRWREGEPILAAFSKYGKLDA